jgi:hypothetical protein
MLVKAIIIFLLLMALLGMVGNWLFPGVIKRSVEKRRKPANCPKCGRHMIGRGRCACGQKG